MTPTASRRLSVLLAGAMGISQQDGWRRGHCCRLARKPQRQGRVRGSDPSPRCRFLEGAWVAMCTCHMYRAWSAEAFAGRWGCRAGTECVCRTRDRSSRVEESSHASTRRAFPYSPGLKLLWPLIVGRVSGPGVRWWRCSPRSSNGSISVGERERIRRSTPSRRRVGRPGAPAGTSRASRCRAHATCRRVSIGRDAPGLVCSPGFCDQRQRPRNGTWRAVRKVSIRSA